MHATTLAGLDIGGTAGRDDPAAAGPAARGVAAWARDCWTARSAQAVAAGPGELPFPGSHPAELIG